ncbi:predicted protein [Sclerotinia sclerotiorum 1980 UF-70]|uniref:Uncharacterized protein n=1 Tax=Sclerotinia sclerotiorum (strain ATCC 18683 / 1980 / Ss-1) TaxID=665079 RepID=A7EKW9_SCLS1|nr:predicted protein [Sclerotinia sclerotiorum 1980 UF-70]EDO03485.1 predicted protein [Sclerotinia sclerotiorum 1980 UF-70]
MGVQGVLDEGMQGPGLRDRRLSKSSFINPVGAISGKMLNLLGLYGVVVSFCSQCILVVVSNGQRVCKIGEILEQVVRKVYERPITYFIPRRAKPR